jgi:hypothetical protein
MILVIRVTITGQFGKKCFLGVVCMSFFVGKGFRTGNNLIKYSSIARQMCLPGGYPHFQHRKNDTSVRQHVKEGKFSNLKKRKENIPFCVLFFIPCCTVLAALKPNTFWFTMRHTATAYE